MSDSEPSNLNRRLLFAATGVVAAAATTAAGAQEVGRPRVRAQSVRYNRTTEYGEAKAALTSSQRFAWLAPFKQERFVDAIIHEAVAPLEREEPPFDPYQLESLISTTSAALDRCLAYRRELYELEEQAVRRALEYKLFEDQFDAQVAIEMAPHVEVQRRIEADGQAKAAGKFKNAHDALGDGFKLTAETGAMSSDEAAKAEATRRQHVERKWLALANFQSAMEDRHNTPGHALNFAERAERLRALLQQDVATAYQKCQCIAAGFGRIFGAPTPLPAVTREGYLDTLVMYVRQVITQYELTTSEEVEFEFTVSLRQPRMEQSGAAANPLVNEAAWKAHVDAKNDGLLTFDLKSEFPAAMKRLRIKGVGLSYVSDKPGDLAARLRSVAGVLFPPMVDNLFSPNSKRVRPPLPMSRVAYYDPLQVRYVSNPSVINVDPRGTWSLQLSSNMIWPDDVAHARQIAELKDVKLHLRLAGLFDKDVAAWKAISIA